MGAVCDKWCEGCRYLGVTAGGLNNCRYWELEDAIRGCPAGAGCDKKRTARKKTVRKYIPTSEGGGMPPALRVAEQDRRGSFVADAPQDDTPSVAVGDSPLSEGAEGMEDA